MNYLIDVLFGSRKCMCSNSHDIVQLAGIFLFWPTAILILSIYLNSKFPFLAFLFCICSLLSQNYFHAGIGGKKTLGFLLKKWEVIKILVPREFLFYSFRYLRCLGLAEMLTIFTDNYLVWLELVNLNLSCVVIRK